MRTPEAAKQIPRGFDTPQASLEENPFSSAFFTAFVPVLFCNLWKLPKNFFLLDFMVI